MTSSLPQEVRDAFERYITCEYTTVGAEQQPITWPVTPYYSHGTATIDVTTGIGYPKKALDARRNPHVGLLFSDPTGSGLERAPTVLVQGTAAVDDRDLAENRRRYRRESLAKLPATRRMLPPKPIEPLFRWYFDRIYVKVRPERVFVWEGGDPSAEPALLGAHLEEVRSGHSEEPADPHAPAEGGPGRWDARMSQLGERHPTAVVSWVAPDGFPLAARVPISLDERHRRVRLEGEAAGLPLGVGRACLTAHAHAPDFAWQENFQVRGDLVRDGGGWALVPQRLIGGFELPDESTPARYRRNFRKMMRFRRAARRYRQTRDA